MQCRGEAFSLRPLLRCCRTETELRRLDLNFPSVHAEARRSALCAALRGRGKKCPVDCRVPRADKSCPEANSGERSLWPTRPEIQAGPLTFRSHAFSNSYPAYGSCIPCLAGLFINFLAPPCRGFTHPVGGVTERHNTEQLPIVCTKDGHGGVTTLPILF
jgi:hypothetical protein